MKSEKLEIINKNGLKLQAYLELPANQHPNYYAVFAHCFSCNSTFNAVKNVTRALTSFGYRRIHLRFYPVR